MIVGVFVCVYLCLVMRNLMIEMGWQLQLPPFSHILQIVVNVKSVLRTLYQTIQIILCISEVLLVRVCDPLKIYEHTATALLLVPTTIIQTKEKHISYTFIVIVAAVVQ